MTKNIYVGGNQTVGHYQGEFSSIEEAWSNISKRYEIEAKKAIRPVLKKSEKEIYMYIEKINEYGFKQLIFCKEGKFEVNEITSKAAFETTNETGLYIFVYEQV